MIPVSAEEWEFILRCLISIQHPPDHIDIDALRTKAQKSRDLQRRREALNATT